MKRMMKNVALLVILVGSLVSCQNREDGEILSESDCLDSPSVSSDICKGETNNITIYLDGYCSSQAGDYAIRLKRNGTVIKELGTHYIDLPNSYVSLSFWGKKTWETASNYTYELVRTDGAHTITLYNITVDGSCCVINPEYTKALCQGESNSLSLKLNGYCQNGDYTVYLKRGSSVIKDLGTHYFDVGNNTVTMNYWPPGSLTSGSGYYYELVRTSGNWTLTFPSDVMVQPCSTVGAIVTSPVGGYDDYFERDGVDATWHEEYFDVDKVRIEIISSTEGVLKTYTGVNNDGLKEIFFPTIGGDKPNCYVKISGGGVSYETGTFTIWDD